MPGRPNKAFFPKEDFKIDLEAGTCTCPAGVVTRVQQRMKSHPDREGGWQRPWGFVFEAGICRACALRSECVGSKKDKGRTVTLHPQEGLLQQARALQNSEAFGEYRQRRQVVEHRLARLVQLGIRQGRYFGRIKTLFQLLMAATVANLTLVATKLGMIGKANEKSASLFAALYSGLFAAIAVSVIPVGLMRVAITSITLPSFANRGYRPDF